MSHERANWFQRYAGDLSRAMHVSQDSARHLPEYALSGPGRRVYERTISYVRVEACFLGSGSPGYADERKPGAVDRQWILEHRVLIDVAGIVHAIPMQFATDFVREVHWIPSLDAIGNARILETRPAALFEPISVRDGERVRVSIDPPAMTNVHVDVLLGGSCRLYEVL